MIIVDSDDRELGTLHVPYEPQTEYYIGLREAVEPGQRLKVVYRQADTGFSWLYGYVHVN